MNVKSSAHYQREFRRRLREQGLVKKEVWILPENAKRLAAIEKVLRKETGTRTGFGELFAEGFGDHDGEHTMTENPKPWTTSTLYKALQGTSLLQEKRASVELIDGVDASLHLVMHEFGDLPIFMTVVGDQIIAESVLWSTEMVSSVAAFNDTVLRTHKYFPLSTISLDTAADGRSYYHMFGALSSTSILSNVVFEIEVLASNVIQATEAYSEFLELAIEA